MANTTPDPMPTPDVLPIGSIAAASDMLLFGDPGLVLFGGGDSHAERTYHGLHRSAE